MSEGEVGRAVAGRADWIAARKKLRSTAGAGRAIETASSRERAIGPLVAEAGRCATGS